MKKSSQVKTGAFKQIAILASYLKKNKNALKTRRMIERIRTILTLSNMEIVKIKKTDPLYVRRVTEFNQAIIIMTQGKWYTTRAMDLASEDYWEKAFNKFKEGLDYSNRLYKALTLASIEELPLAYTSIADTESEISYADDSPLIPEINPIVILKGSDYEMGYQYAQQLAGIFGKWILARKAGRQFSGEEREILSKWEEQLKIYAPELLPFCRGWADGARDAGVPMTYEDVLDIWTGHQKPAESIMGLAEALPTTGAPLCSGIAAWGRATPDGKLVTGSSGDHDVSFMVTIAAFPETGNNFVYTPFGATGDVAKLGPMLMTGHPGMNSKGVAYIEHGGEPRYIEDKKYWGYGIRKGAAVFHILRFANSAREACEMELNMPVGDVGTNFGSVGGFFADSSYGYILESRKDPVIVREAGVMGETDFLYVNNSALHPDVNKAEWLKKDADNWEWHPHGGWHPSKFTMVKKLGGVDEIVKSVMRTGYENSFHRNVFLYERLHKSLGRIDMGYMRDIYKEGGTLPQGEWKKISRAYNKTGKWGRITTGHASNALVTLMKPDNGNEGIYSLCVGSAARGLAPMGPTFCTPIHNETNAFWEFVLAENPLKSAQKAGEKASEELKRAEAMLKTIFKHEALYRFLSNIYKSAGGEMDDGNRNLELAEASESGKSVYAAGRAIRKYTRCQVYARQIIQLIEGL